MTTKPRMPAEWESHRATWIAWPYQEFDFPGKIEPVRWVYTEIIRHLAQSERVEMLCLNFILEEGLQRQLKQSGITGDLKIHNVPHDRSWLRDSMPIAVKSGDNISWVSWVFNAWAKYDNFQYDQKLPEYVKEETNKEIIQAFRSDGKTRLVLEGGAIDVDGLGTLLTTEECLLSNIQERNPGLSREEYEAAFAEYLGVTKTIWLGESCEGDDTHGHVDDAARFVAPGVIALAYCDDTSDPNHKKCVDNLKRLEAARDARGEKLKIVKLPSPSPIYFDDYRLPASYANFYIGNSVVLVPTFNDPNDRIAMNIIADLFPTRKIIGIHSVDLILGYGSLHCLTQQEPL